MSTFAARITEISTHLDGGLESVRTAEAATRRANAGLGHAAGNLASGSERIARALASMAESATRLRAAEARLSFESARLKRSSKNIREGLDRLGEAGAMLERRAQTARAVAETADRTATLITAIETASARGEAIDHLLAAGRDIAGQAGTLRRAR